MADEIFNVAPPAWLQAIAQPIDPKVTGRVLAQALTGAIGASERGHEPIWKTDRAGKPYMEERGGSWFKNFLGAASEARMSMADPLWRIKANQLQLKTQADVLNMVETQADINLKRSTLAENAHDAEVWPKWMQENKDNLLLADPPNLYTAKYNNLYNQTLAQRSAMENTRITSYAVRDFYKRVDGLPASMRYSVSSLMPQAGDPKFDDKLKAAMAKLGEAESQAAALRPSAGGTAGGLPLYSLNVKDEFGNTATYRAASTTIPGPVLTDWNRRLDWMRNADYSSYQKFADLTTPPDTSTPEGLARMNDFNNTEGAVRARLEFNNQAAAAAPGARATTTIGPSGLPSRTITTTPTWTGAPPPTIDLFNGGKIVPKPVYAAGGQLVNYDMQYISPSGTQKTLTPQALSSMARDLSDQLVAGQMSNMPPDKKMKIQATIDTMNDIVDKMVQAELPAIRQQIKEWGTPMVPPPRGTNTSGGKTNYNFGADGVLRP